MCARGIFASLTLPTICHDFRYCSYLQAPQDVLEITAPILDIADKQPLDRLEPAFYAWSCTWTCASRPRSVRMSLFLELPSGKWVQKPTNSGAATR